MLYNCIYFQIASQVLKIPTEKVFINETSTDTIPNTSPTAASGSSDIYGGAVKVILNNNSKIGHWL